MSSTYIDCFQYQRQPTGLTVTLSDYIGNQGRLSLPCAASAAKLTTPALTIALNQYDNIYIFDGPNSEIVQTSGAVIGATSIPLQTNTQFAHATGTPYCTDGMSGSLGEQIFTASQWIEDDICFQALWAIQYTNEILTIPTMRASLDNQGNLHFRPRHFPITNLASVAIQSNAFNKTLYDQTQAIIDSDQQTVDLSPLAILSTQPENQIAQASPWIWGQFNRQTTAWVTITYTSGFAQGSLPWPITRACSLLTSECFVQLENPMGADSISQNKRQVTFVTRGDTTGKTLLVKQAEKLLAKYITQSF